MWVIKFKLSIRILIGGYPQAKMSQGSVDLSSLPCGSSVEVVKYVRYLDYASLRSTVVCGFDFVSCSQNLD